MEERLGRLKRRLRVATDQEISIVQQAAVIRDNEERFGLAVTGDALHAESHLSADGTLTIKSQADYNIVLINYSDEDADVFIEIDGIDGGRLAEPFRVKAHDVYVIDGLDDGVDCLKLRVEALRTGGGPGGVLDRTNKTFNGLIKATFKVAPRTSSRDREEIGEVADRHFHQACVDLLKAIRNDSSVNEISIKPEYHLTKLCFERFCDLLKELNPVRTRTPDRQRLRRPRKGKTYQYQVTITGLEAIRKRWLSRRDAFDAYVKEHGGRIASNGLVLAAGDEEEEDDDDEEEEEKEEEVEVEEEEEEEDDDEEDEEEEDDLSSIYLDSPAHMPLTPPPVACRAESSLAQRSAAAAPTEPTEPTTPTLGAIPGAGQSPPPFATAEAAAAVALVPAPGAPPPQANGAPPPGVPPPAYQHDPYAQGAPPPQPNAYCQQGAPQPLPLQQYGAPAHQQPPQHGAEAAETAAEAAAAAQAPPPIADPAPYRTHAAIAAATKLGKPSSQVHARTANLIDYDDDREEALFIRLLATCSRGIADDPEGGGKRLKPEPPPPAAYELISEQSQRVFRVSIRQRGSTTWGGGSAVLINAEEGLVLTNNHVLIDAPKPISTTPSPKNLQLDILLGRVPPDKPDSHVEYTHVGEAAHLHPTLDLALIRIVGKLTQPFSVDLVTLPPPPDPWHTIIDTQIATMQPCLHPVLPPSHELLMAKDPLQLGNSFQMLSFPYASKHALQHGLNVVAGNVTAMVGNSDEFYQTDAAIQSGSSGGAIVNDDGELVAVASNSFNMSNKFAGPLGALLKLQNQVAKDWLQKCASRP